MVGIGDLAAGEFVMRADERAVEQAEWREGW